MPNDAISAAGRRILVIEDSIDAAETLGMILQRDGHDIRIAGTGVQGIADARAFNPDVILCDIGLPGIDGYEVARRLRADPALSGIYLVALTGFDRDSDRLKAQEAGFDMHMAKPLDFAALRSALTRLPPRR